MLDTGRVRCRGCCAIELLLSIHRDEVWSTSPHRHGSEDNDMTESNVASVCNYPER